MMEEVQTHLADTIEELAHEAANTPELSEEDHEAHREQLAQRAALLEGRLERLTQAADMDSIDDEHRQHLALTRGELEAIHAEVEASRVYTEEQRAHVLTNLHAVTRNVDRLHNETSATIVNNLREALRIRLSILNDNVMGFVSAQDIDRRDRCSMHARLHTRCRHTSMEVLLHARRAYIYVFAFLIW